MQELLKQKNVQIIEGFNDWKQAIMECCKPLIEQGYCTKEYPQGIIQNTNEMGPYYVLCENFALLHAKSEQGALKTQVAITVLKNPLKFSPDGFDVRILLTLCAIDSTSHMEVLKAVANIFTDTNKVASIINAQDSNEVYEIFVSQND